MLKFYPYSILTPEKTVDIRQRIWNSELFQSHTLPKNDHTGLNGNKLKCIIGTHGHWKNQCPLFFLTWHCQFFYITKYCIQNCIIKFCWISFESSFKPDTNNRIERLQRIWNSELFQSCIIRVWTYEHYDCDIALSLKFFLLNIIWDMGY